MTNSIQTTLTQAVGVMLDTLATGREVALDVTLEDCRDGTLAELIAEIQEQAEARRLGISVTQTGEATIALALVTE